MRLRYAATVCAIVYMFVMSAYLAMRPSYDWDMLPYVAVALHMSGTPTDHLQQATYDAVRAEIPPAAMDALTGQLTPESVAATSSMTTLADTDFRKAVAADPAQFLAQLPFYSVKPVYPVLVALVHAMTGLRPVASGMIVSVTAFFGIGILFFVWFSRWLPPFIAFAVMALLVLNPFLVIQARTVGPDILSIFTLMLGAFLALEDSAIAAVAMFMTAILVRPENILYTVPFSIYLTLKQRSPKYDVAIILTFTAVLIEKAITWAAGAYSWKTLFYYSFVSKTALATQPHLGLLYFLNFYLGRLDHILIGQGELPIFALIGFGALCLKATEPKPLTDRYLHLLLLAVLIGAVRMLILPTQAFRALLPCYMMATVVFIQALAIARQGDRQALFHTAK